MSEYSDSLLEINEKSQSLLETWKLYGKKLCKTISAVSKKTWELLSDWKRCTASICAIAMGLGIVASARGETTYQYTGKNLNRTLAFTYCSDNVEQTSNITATVTFDDTISPDFTGTIGTPGNPAQQVVSGSISAYGVTLNYPNNYPIFPGNNTNSDARFTFDHGQIVKWSFHIDNLEWNDSFITYGSSFGADSFSDCATITRLDPSSLSHVICWIQGGMASKGTWTLVSVPPPIPPQISATPKNEGNQGCPNTLNGDPVNTASGSKLKIQDLYKGEGPTATLTLQLAYNSVDKTSTPFGANWRGTWDRSIAYTAAFGTNPTAKVTREDGRVDTFRQDASSGVWTSDPDVTTRLSSVLDANNTLIGFQIKRDDDSLEKYTQDGRLDSVTTRGGLVTNLSYDANNRLAQVTGPFGQTMTFAYDASNRVSEVTLPDGGKIGLGYAANNNLGVIIYPDGSRIQYLYENTKFPHALTGVIDENGEPYETTEYDSNGLATSTGHAGGADGIAITYNQDGSATITDANGNVITRPFTSQFDLLRPSTTTQNCCGAASYTYDPATGFPTSITDFNGNVTALQHNERGQEIMRTEAAGTPEALTTTTEWHSTFNLPTVIAEPGRTTTLAYDDRGNLKSVTVAADGQSRTWAYTYDDKNQRKTITGPKNDSTKFTYDTKGNLASITDALGRVTKIPLSDANGRPRQIIAPNGLVMNFDYDKRGRLTLSDSGGEKTFYAYDAAGNKRQITKPDGTVHTLDYDNAHRLTSITDPSGNKIVLTLDGNGNVIEENAYNSSGSLTRTRGHAYNAMNDVIQDIGASGEATAYAHDGNGNIIAVTDPLGYLTSIARDHLNRATQITDADGGVTQVKYNPFSDITGVTDPRMLATLYGKNGFGDVTSIQSPDSGKTSNTLDKAGNITVSTNALGQPVRITYNAKKQPTSIRYADGKTVTMKYNNMDKISLISDLSGSTAYDYDQHGRIAKITQKIGKATLITQYAYGYAGRLATKTYPSGMKVANVYDSVSGELTGLVVNGKPLISNIERQPFGPIKGWTMANGILVKRDHDQNGRLRSQTAGSDSFTIARDPEGKVTNIDSEDMAQTFGYDNLSRLTQYANGSDVASWFFDPNGNRTGQNVNGEVTTYAIDPASNRLQSIIDGNATTDLKHDAAGNLIDNGEATFTINADGHVGSITTNGVKTTFQYNGASQRVSRTGPYAGGTLYSAYDGDGQLIGEYKLVKSKLVAQQENIYLRDMSIDMPFIVIKNNTPYYMIPGPLGEPYRFTNGKGNMVWSWKDHDPYGNGAPNQRPGTAAAFISDLRLPGQIDDGNGINLNGYRYYDPKTGRYTQPDPIGLRGGINPYTYAGGDPANNIDPSGLVSFIQIGKGIGQVAWGEFNFISGGMVFIGGLAVDAGTVGTAVPYTLPAQLWAAAQMGRGLYITKTGLENMWQGLDLDQWPGTTPIPTMPKPQRNKINCPPNHQASPGGGSPVY
jgi:RHS repeat-associated protein